MRFFGHRQRRKLRIRRRAGYYWLTTPLWGGVCRPIRNARVRGQKGEGRRTGTCVARMRGGEGAEAPSEGASQLLAVAPTH